MATNLRTLADSLGPLWRWLRRCPSSRCSICWESSAGPRGSQHCSAWPSRAIIAIAVYRMPVTLAVGAITYGAAFGLLPICSGTILWAIFLYRISVETGQFEIIKDSIGGLTQDRHLQALLIAFSFGAFVEGAAGFGARVVAAAMLTGLGFSPFFAAAICLIANTAPVAFGSIGIPVTTLALITGLPLAELSAAVGRICAPISLSIPAISSSSSADGPPSAELLLAALSPVGAAFAGAQFYASNYLGPELTDILGSLAAIAAALFFAFIWKPRDHSVFHGASAEVTLPHRHPMPTVFALAALPAVGRLRPGLGPRRRQSLPQQLHPPH